MARTYNTTHNQVQCTLYKNDGLSPKLQVKQRKPHLTHKLWSFWKVMKAARWQVSLISKHWSHTPIHNGMAYNRQIDDGLWKGKFQRHGLVNDNKGDQMFCVSTIVTDVPFEINKRCFQSACAPVSNGYPTCAKPTLWMVSALFFCHGCQRCGDCSDDRGTLTL